MSDRPKCFGEYESGNEICEKCRFIDPCEIQTIKSKKKSKTKEKTNKEEDNFLDDIYRAASEDTVTRLYRLRKDAIKDGDTAMVKLLSAELINAIRAKLKDKEQEKNQSPLEKALYDSSIKRLTDDPVENTLKLANKLGSFGGKSDTEAIAGAFESSIKELSGTVKEVFGRHKLDKVLEDDKYANEWTKCGVCGQMINHPDPKSCPSCGATGETSEQTEPISDSEEPINESDIDCFGTYNETDSECQNCEEAKKCRDKKEKGNKPKFEKVNNNKSLPEGADDFLDDIHRICEWIDDGVDAKKNTTTLYMLGVGKRIQKQRKPKKANIDKVKGTILTSEIGMPKLLEIATQFKDYPEAQEYEIKEMIEVLSTKKAEGFIHTSWSTLKALAEQDDIILTNEERESMIADMNEFSDIKLNPEDYFKEDSKRAPKETPSKEPKKKGPKKKSTKKKIKPKKKKEIEAKKKKIAETTETECPLCHTKMMISELKDHIKDCEG